MYNPQSKQWRPPQQSSCSARRRLFACICCHLVDTGVIAALAVMEWLYNRGHYKVPLHITMSFVYSAHFDYCGNQPALSEMTTRCRERLTLLCWSSILMLSFTCPFVSKVNIRTPFCQISFIQTFYPPRSFHGPLFCALQHSHRRCLQTFTPPYKCKKQLCFWVRQKQRQRVIQRSASGCLTELALHPGVVHRSTPTALGGAQSLLRPTGFISLQEICELLPKHPITAADAACWAHCQ